ncbi:hypothetical protein CRG98_043679 [Punica granatum]|uniref:Uncharacterized protein n=1 Tax=Punica granatum TaxID=22663 RepID=A0A2I0HW42_PUNGR|nr:hypothetical protein CRG98_043679 [Punica granatum]
MTLLIAVGSVELPGYVRPRLTYPIRVVFHIDTTKSEAISRTRPDFVLGLRALDVRTRPGGLNSADRLEGALGRRVGPASWAGLDRGGLGHARGNWASGEEAGPQRALDLRRVGPNGLDLPTQTEKIGRARERENVGEDEEGRRGGSNGQERRFPPLGAAATEQVGAGDGGEHRLGCVVLETSITRLRPVRISSFFLWGFEFFR